MARYIDADALYKKLYPLDLADKRTYTINAKAVADAIANIPTADVVPKSEVVAMMQWVELLKGQLAEAKSEVETLTVRLEMNEKAYDSLRELYHTDTDALVEARRKTEVEVARKIFEEIENMISPMLGLEDDKEYVAILSKNFVELKKKYTEEDYDRDPKD